MKDDRYGEKWKRSCIRIIIDDGIDINIQKRNIRDFSLKWWQNWLKVHTVIFNENLTEKNQNLIDIPIRLASFKYK